MSDWLSKIMGKRPIVYAKYPVGKILVKVDINDLQRMARVIRELAGHIKTLHQHVWVDKDNLSDGAKELVTTSVVANDGTE